MLASETNKKGLQSSYEDVLKNHDYDYGSSMFGNSSSRIHKSFRSKYKARREYDGGSDSDSSGGGGGSGGGYYSDHYSHKSSTQASRAKKPAYSSRQEGGGGGDSGLFTSLGTQQHKNFDTESDSDHYEQQQQPLPEEAIVISHQQVLSPQGEARAYEAAIKEVLVRPIYWAIDGSPHISEQAIKDTLKGYRMLDYITPSQARNAVYLMLKGFEEPENMKHYFCVDSDLYEKERDIVAVSFLNGETDIRICTNFICRFDAEQAMEVLTKGLASAITKYSSSSPEWIEKYMEMGGTRLKSGRSPPRAAAATTSNNHDDATSRVTCSYAPSMHVIAKGKKIHPTWQKKYFSPVYPYGGLPCTIPDCPGRQIVQKYHQGMDGKYWETHRQ